MAAKRKKAVKKQRMDFDEFMAEYGPFQQLDRSQAAVLASYGPLQKDPNANRVITINGADTSWEDTPKDDRPTVAELRADGMTKDDYTGYVEYLTVGFSYVNAQYYYLAAKPVPYSLTGKVEIWGGTMESESTPYDGSLGGVSSLGGLRSRAFSGVLSGGEDGEEEEYLDIYVEEHPGGKKYGWVISSLYQDGNSGPSGEARTKKEAIKMAKEFANDSYTEKVSVLVDGSWYWGKK